jgi:hypothetical protein
VHALEESDRAILSMNQKNKEERFSAEPGEKRVRAKENLVQPNTNPTQRGKEVFQGMSGVRVAALLAFSKVGAVCGNAACTVQCGGRSAMIVPTATF